MKTRLNNQKRNLEEINQLLKPIKKNKKSLAVCVLGIINLILLVVDFLSTIRLGELVQYLEANPLYNNFGLFGIVLINIGLIILLAYKYNKTKSIDERYIIILIFIIIIFIRLFVIMNNIEIGNHPPTIEEAKAITQEMKISTIKNVVLIWLTTYLIAIISFGIFKIDHKIEVKD